MLITKGMEESKGYKEFMKDRLLSKEDVLSKINKKIKNSFSIPQTEKTNPNRKNTAKMMLKNLEKADYSSYNDRKRKICSI